MARREYRSPTGKLRGYSQTDTERTGGKAGVVSVLLVMGGAAIWQYFSGPSPTPSPAAQQAVTIAQPQSRASTGQTTALPEVHSAEVAIGGETTPSEDQSVPAPNRPEVAIIKGTSLYHIESGSLTALMVLPVGTSVHHLGAFGNGWEHVELTNTPDGKTIEGYIPSWSLPQNE